MKTEFVGFFIIVIRHAKTDTKTSVIAQYKKRKIVALWK